MTNNNAEHLTKDNLDQIDLNELTSMTSWQQRYKTIMQWSKLINHKEQIRNSDNLVSGCESDVWMTHKKINDLNYFAVDSDSRIVKGLACILLSVSNAQDDVTIKDINFEKLFEDLGFKQHLSPSRANGFFALTNKIKSSTN